MCADVHSVSVNPLDFFPSVSESGRFVCGWDFGRLSGRHSAIDSWYCVWSAQRQVASLWDSLRPCVSTALGTSKVLSNEDPSGFAGYASAGPFCAALIGYRCASALTKHRSGVCCFVQSGRL